MPPLNRNRCARIVALALLTLIGAASPSHAAALYTMTDLGPTTGIVIDTFNSSGQITAGNAAGHGQDGSYYIQNLMSENGDGYHAYLGIVGQAPTELAPPPQFPLSENSFAYAVNQAGTVVGVLGVDDPIHVAFVYTQAGGMQLVPVPYPQTYPFITLGQANSINDLGAIVGTALVSNGISGNQNFAFLTVGQQSWDLNTLITPGSGLLLTSASDINDAGQILAVAYDSQNREHNVLLTPIPSPAPEPATFVVLAAGGLAFGWRRRIGRSRADQTGSSGA